MNYFKVRDNRYLNLDNIHHISFYENGDQIVLEYMINGSLLWMENKITKETHVRLVKLLDGPDKKENAEITLTADQMIYLKRIQDMLEEFDNREAK